MSREILFRGKRIDNGKWIYGSLIIKEQLGDASKYYTVLTRDDNDWTSKYYEGAVDENTIGQFIERYDFYGTRIFDGDIIQFRPRNCNGDYIYKDFRRAMVVAYEKGVPQYRFLDKFDRLWKDSTKEYYKDEKQENNQSREFGDYTEVIGNIYDGILESKLKGVWFKEEK